MVHVHASGFAVANMEFNSANLLITNIHFKVIIRRGERGH